MPEWRRCPECNSLKLAQVLVLWPSGWQVKKLVCQPFGHLVDVVGCKKNIS